MRGMASGSCVLSCTSLTQMGAVFPRTITGSGVWLYRSPPRRVSSFSGSVIPKFPSTSVRPPTSPPSVVEQTPANPGSPL